MTDYLTGNIIKLWPYMYIAASDVRMSGPAHVRPPTSARNASLGYGQ